jgi:serine/threonine protein kinase
MADKSLVKNQSLYTPSPIKEYEGNREKELKFTLKDFEVQNKIGQGNFSVVFKAVCKLTDLEVALKIVKKESVGLMKQVDHILNERAILKYL